MRTSRLRYETNVFFITQEYLRWRTLAEQCERESDITPMPSLMCHSSIVWYSDAIPDLCSVAETIIPPYEIVLYWGTDDMSDIVEEYDEPGNKGNYGGLWYTLGTIWGVNTSTPEIYLSEMCRVINAKFDALGWSSATAPEGEQCFDAFPTTEEGLVVVECPDGSLCVHAEVLLHALGALSAPISYANVLAAISPLQRKE